MATDDQGSITRWIDDLKAGDPTAAGPLWERYFDRLVRLARARLAAGRSRGEADEEDAALSAFQSLCAGAARGRFPGLGDRDDLWRLLVVLTARKVMEQARRQARLKRGGGTVRAAARGPEEAPSLDQVAGDEPTPEFAAMVAEEYGRRLDALGDDALRRVAVWRMEGYTSDEIADRLGCARRTVARRLDLIRKTWLEDEA